MGQHNHGIAGVTVLHLELHTMCVSPPWHQTVVVLVRGGQQGTGNKQLP